MEPLNSVNLFLIIDFFHKLFRLLKNYAFLCIKNVNRQVI